jgi:adenylate cyclase
MGLTALATATTLLLGDLDRAGHFVDRALALDPNNAWAWSRRGFIDAYRGKSDAAIAAFEHATRLSPLDPFSYNTNVGLAFAHFGLKRYDAAIAWMERAVRENRGTTWAQRDFAAFYACAGRLDEAKRAAQALLATRPHLTVAGVGRALCFVEPGILKRYLDALKLSGVPEG